MSLLQRQHEAGQKSIAELQVENKSGFVFEYWCTMVLRIRKSIRFSLLQLQLEVDQEISANLEVGNSCGIFCMWTGHWMCTGLGREVMRVLAQARSEEEAVGLQAQLEIAGAEVDRAHARLAALELEHERAARQVGQDILHQP